MLDPSSPPAPLYHTSHPQHMTPSNQPPHASSLATTSSFSQAFSTRPCSPSPPSPSRPAPCCRWSASARPAPPPPSLTDPPLRFLRSTPLLLGVPSGRKSSALPSRPPPPPRRFRPPRGWRRSISRLRRSASRLPSLRGEPAPRSVSRARCPAAAYSGNILPERGSSKCANAASRPSSWRGQMTGV